MTAHPLQLAASASGPASASRASSASGPGLRWLSSAMEMAGLAGSRAGSDQPAAPHPATAVLGTACFPRIATRTPGVDAGSVRGARDFTVATLRRWGMAERCDDVAIVVSELLTNALRHALPRCAPTGPRWPVRLGLLQPGPCVLCAVADPSERAPVPPVPADPDQLAESGRGLQVVNALSDAWGYTPPTAMGKVVWALFSAGPR